MKNILDKISQLKEKALITFNRKESYQSILSDISNILDPHDMEILILRDKNCGIIFTNAEIHERFSNNDGDYSSCNSTYAKHFPELCNHCPLCKDAKNNVSSAFELNDISGRTFSVKHNAINWTDGKPATIFIFRDISQEKETNERLYSLAYIDQLTGVPNRQKLKEDFSVIEDKLSQQEPISGIVALFDLDHFKAINDTYGHNTGDVVLRRLTEHLSENSYFTNKLYRLGGDEFVILLTNPSDAFNSQEEAENHYTEILSTALHAYTLPTISLECTLSIGVSFFPKHGATLSDMLKKADIALYQAKADGRNRIFFFNDH
ncbi:MAG: GGDEF domain-containing protein [Oscillospiraceae bacterium]|nr:GGDEF domain-containing protein [Oscillospiraceae bacterium]